MGSSRRRAVLVLIAALILAVAAWIASALVPATRISFGGEDGEGGLTVSAELPAAECRKVFTSEFPWVRIGCEPKPDDAGEGGDAPVSGGLDTPADAE